MKAFLLFLLALLVVACSSADVELGADGDDAGAPRDADVSTPMTTCTADDAANHAPCALPPGVGFCIAEGCCMDPGEGIDACPDGGAS